MNMKSRKGTVMVEAALIFPLVSAAVAAVIYIVICLYSSLSLQASLHRNIRNECGEFSQTVYRNEKIRNYDTVMGMEGIRPVIRTEEETEYGMPSLYKLHLIKKERGRSYVIDEAELVRILSLGEDEL